MSQLGEILPAVNAGLNSLSAVLLLGGRWAIKSRQVKVHRGCMLGATGVSALFLLCYLTRFALTGTHRFPGTGLARALYLTILGSHMLLAVAVPVLALMAIQLARRARLQAHVKVVKYAWPIWMYVSVTGVLVYAMLYHWPR